MAIGFLASLVRLGSLLDVPTSVQIYAIQFSLLNDDVVAELKLYEATLSARAFGLTASGGPAFAEAGSSLTTKLSLATSAFIRSSTS